ncbi:MAG: hypothetical protein IKJ81_10295 [Bacteroidales bacterium]|nr:hypothetical protein [Bacteroidales bacterium]
MNKIILFFVFAFVLASGAVAQNANDSITIRGQILLALEDNNSPEPYPDAAILIEGGGRLLSTTATNNDGEFSFKMPKGVYKLFLWQNQSYKGYPLLLEGDLHRKVDAQTSVDLGEWTVGVGVFIPLTWGPDSKMQMKVDGVNVTVQD